MSTGSLPTAAPGVGGSGPINPIMGILQTCVKLNGADIHFKAHLPPKVLVDGKIIPVPGFETNILDPRIIPQMLFALLPPSQMEQFKTDKEIDTAFDIPGLARFRANIFMNLGTVGAVLRIIQNDIRTTDDLGLPPVLKKIALEKQGLILVTGPTGSGKSTTLAAVINFINETIAGHLVSIEDPVELVHNHKKCIISQREVGKDTNSFARALKSALRQAPNVILIGELRDRETIELALKGAETGHLVLSTLHTNDAVQTINRILNAFPPAEQEAMRLTVANTLKCCIAQRLVGRIDGKGRSPILDILVNTSAVRDCIIKGQLDQLYDLIKGGGFDGMQSTNQALLNLYKGGVIDYATCMSTAEDKQGMGMMLRSEMRSIKESAEAILTEKRRVAAEAEKAARLAGEPSPAAQAAEAKAASGGGTGELRSPEAHNNMETVRTGTGSLRPPPEGLPPQRGTGSLAGGPQPPARPGSGPLKPPPPGAPPPRPGGNTGGLKR